MHSSKSFVFTFAFCVISFSIFGQSQIKEYVKSHTVRISTIDPRASNDSELEIIDKAIGSATIVMLGEQDHGDAATFQAKTRLIKYLHEKKGFDVLAFESDFFSLNEGWDHLKKEASQIKSFLRQNITPIWSDCDACSTLLFDYVPDTYTTDDPLSHGLFFLVLPV